MYRTIDRFNLFGIIDGENVLQVGIQQNINEERDICRIERKARSAGVSSGGSGVSCPSSALGGSGSQLPASESRLLPMVHE